jgi:hypothetical protein
MTVRLPRALLALAVTTPVSLLHAQGRPPARASGSFTNCKTSNNKALHDVEVHSRTATLPASERARYTTMHAALGPETSLAECRARGEKIDTLSNALNEMAALAAPATTVGVKGQGGIVVRLRSGSTYGLAAYTADQPVRGGMTQQSAIQSCSNLVANGHSDWYLPSAEDIGPVWHNRAAVGGFKDSEYYWTTTLVNGQDWKAYARRWSEGDTYSWNIHDDSPQRPLFQGRCVRKF